MEARPAIDARKARILRAIIEDYVLTAMPVGSRTISRKYETGLSSATIRNEMSDLEELGYLAQPHVSAGRVPSVKAYRLYVDELLGGSPVPQDAAAKAYFSQRVRQLEDVITSAAQAISEITRYTAVVMMPKQLELRVSCLQLVPMPRGSALLVIVTDTGAIRDTVIRVSENLDGDALYAISRMLTERLSGRTLQEVQEMLGAYARQAGSDARVLQGIADLAAQMEKQSATDTVTVGGSHNILNYPEYSDVEKARAFLSVLEKRERLMQLLSGQEAGFTVRIGPETGVPEMADCSVVTASYRVGAGHQGFVGVIGPTRMPYGRVLSALGTVGGALSDMLGE
uniref:Heat-inducible transcription repressor HrcA n=1 Tax=uncultured bacterium Ad_144_C12_contig1 TaxID=1489308 RepID=A0A0B4N081_9BACT|nr:putative heat-inducible transcription repressor hrcA [uncultured bacterium Ad_144_C12_contig1]